ncbi:MAG: acetyl-CoA carboxylase biotin carboxylase subunit [Lentisphaerae bacterium]|jgi:acetyl-CoA carboxylase biotin carboxylase subunit|nr:acetyl-CoA carboxylase biotin carboxylase subunit [Lentisphaerota bacterium]
MFKRILIANRGEIAVRVIRACRELGIRTVAVYSQADESCLHVQLADEAVCIGKAPASESYLKTANIISAAEVTDVDAIHPGFGFLSENAHFAEICEDCGITFIGPPPEIIRDMGDKARARELMQRAGVPVTPGSDGVVKSAEAAVAVAKRLGYPVLVKAVAGGGGKGMRIARNDMSLTQGFTMASSEAERAFGNRDIYVEKLIERARHIEVQLLADNHGHVYQLGERDCSIQRRHQKLIEEAPSPALTPERRRKLLKAAVRAAQACRLRNVATIEFLWDEDTQEFYFMEMNTRIQVEHPITEEVTGTDLVQLQIRAAAGEVLKFSERDFEPRGHAIEVRVNAENPYRNFTPSPGMVEAVHFPGGPGIRVDSHVYSGYEIPPHYDSMIGKIIARGRTREEALRRMARALAEFKLVGPATTVPVAQALLADARFRRGEYTTHFLEQFMNDVFWVP